MTNPQSQRRRDPYPWTWEIPVGIATVVLLLMAIGLHIGRAFANLMAGAGWQVPALEDLFTTVPGVLRGDAAAGLTGSSEPTATPTALTFWIIAVEIVLIAGVIVALKF